MLLLLLRVYQSNNFRHVVGKTENLFRVALKLDTDLQANLTENSLLADRRRHAGKPFYLDGELVLKALLCNCANLLIDVFWAHS